MIDLLKRNPLIGALAVLCAALAAVVALEIVRGSTSTPGATARKAAPPEAKLLPPVAVSNAEQLYPETTARPLWIPTRRPAPVAPAVATTMVRGQFILQGVTIAGETKIAMLKEKSTGRLHRVEKGREVNGLQVVEVEPEKVTLSQGGEREVVDLRVQRPGAPAPAGAPPPPGTPTPQPAPAAYGPFGPVPGAPPVAPAAAPAPGQPPATGTPPSPFGAPLVAPPPPPGAVPNPAASSANPSQQAMPQQAASAPMTPEELLARRRARRNQTP